MGPNLLVFVNYYGKASETFISDEITFLRQQKHYNLDVLHYGEIIPEKRVYGLKMPSSPRKRLIKALGKINFLALKSLKYRNGLNGSLIFLIEFFKKHHYDIIYCHFGPNGKLIAQLKELGVIPKETKLIVRFHGLDMTLSKYPIGYYEILNRYGNVFLVGSRYASNLLRVYKFDERKVKKLPVGLKKRNIGLKVSKLNPQNICRILSVGRLIELKGHHVAIEILALLKKKGVPFYYKIIGSGIMAVYLKQMIVDNDLTKEVEIVSQLTHEEVLDEMRRYDIYLYPGIYDKNNRVEAQGLANIEAMANGMIIVASNIGGVPDYVIEGETGFLCGPGNIEEFAEKLKWVIDNYRSDKIIEVKRNAIRIVSQNYCQESLNQKLLNVLIQEGNAR